MRQRVPGAAARFFFALVLVLASLPAAAESSHCAAGSIVLWGDGQHDDTAALNAWFRGEDAVWGDSGEPVGPAIAGRSFLLSRAIYTPGGTSRILDRFKLVWPDRHETVTGDRLDTGADPDAPPAAVNIRITGGDSGEGVAFHAPDPPRRDPDSAGKCLIS